MKRTKHRLPATARHVGRRTISRGFLNALSHYRNFMVYPGHADLNMIIPEDWQAIANIYQDPDGVFFLSPEFEVLGFLSGEYYFDRDEDEEIEDGDEEGGS
ncbi:hypothetical protein ES705_28985 [subsurface metagenome]